MSTMESDNEGVRSFPGPIVRDYLYVDLGRVQSLLTQIANGRPDLIIDRVKGVSSVSAQLDLGLLGAGFGRSKGSEAEEQRSLTDLHFALFEQGAEALGLLTDVTEAVANVDAWTSGEVHSSLNESQLVRVTCPVRLVDPVYFEQSIERIDKMVQAFVPLSILREGSAHIGSAGPRRSGGSPNRQRTGGSKIKDSAFQEQRAKLLGGTSPELIFGLRDIILGMLSGGIAMRSMPCGERHPECAFSGVLLDRSNYIEPERSAVFSRFGARASTWTLVGLITRFGTTVGEEGGNQIAASPAQMSRIGLEEMVVNLLEMLERSGVADAPTWPGVALTPLALYRVLPVAEHRKG